MSAVFDGTFPHNWTAEILPSRPLILPSRHYVYPAAAEEVERGALEVLIQPAAAPQAQREDTAQKSPFLATCALGFRDPAAPTGIWAMPNPDWLCAVSGGYAYLIDATEPSQFVFLSYRPVLNVLPYLPKYPPGGLLLFTGHHSILAWGRNGEDWESERLSWEGITDLRMDSGSRNGTDGDILRGFGWDLPTDQEIPFTLDLKTGKRI